MKKGFISLLFIIISYCAYNQIVVGTEIGNLAPEINLSNPNGENIALSSLRGKVVLIDFWASWCGPCRQENPNVVKTYKEYKDKKFTIGDGFTIYGVSADRDKKSWEDAIAKDNLSWTNVSDLKYWSSIGLATYGINAIPSNVLIDAKGIIIAKNLRGKALAETLEKYIVKDPVLDSKKSLESFLYEVNNLKNAQKDNKYDKDFKQIESKIKEIQDILNKF